VFSLVEGAAAIDPSARVHDSVVLGGATVEAGAVLVRSVVCGGATVRRDTTAVDRFVLGGGKSRLTPALGLGGIADQLPRPALAASAAAVP
jgi:hypothetical protein